MSFSWVFITLQFECASVSASALFFFLRSITLSGGIFCLSNHTMILEEEERKNIWIKKHINENMHHVPTDLPFSVLPMLSSNPVCSEPAWNSDLTDIEIGIVMADSLAYQFRRAQTPKKNLFRPRLYLSNCTVNILQNGSHDRI